MSRRALRAHALRALCAAALLSCDGGSSASPPAPPANITLPAPPALQRVSVGGALLGVWGEERGGRVWFVGGRVEESGEGERHVARYEGGRLALSWRAPGAPLWWAWGDDAGGVWAAGEEGAIYALSREASAVSGAGGAGDAPWAEEWTPERVELPDELRARAVLWGLWGDGAGGVWAVGGSQRRGGPRGLLLRRDLTPAGPVWRRVEDPALPTEDPDDPTAGLNRFKLWGEGGAEGQAWAAGEGGLLLWWPRGLGGPATRLRLTAPEGEEARDLLFTLHGAPGGRALAVGGYAEGVAWARAAGAAQDPAQDPTQDPTQDPAAREAARWAPLGALRDPRDPRAPTTPPLNGVSCAGDWAHLVGARGSLTRLWLGEGDAPAQVLTVEGAEHLTLHAAWSLLSADPTGADPTGADPTGADPAAGAPAAALAGGEGGAGGAGGAGSPLADNASGAASPSPLTSPPPRALWAVGGDLESRREGVIVTLANTPLTVEPWP